MSTNSKFVQAVKKAKGLYKTGRYKTFADAVGAAYRKNKIGSSRSSTSTKAHTSGNRTATTTKTITAHVKVGRVKKAGKKTKFRQTGTSNKRIDRQRTAKRPGKRKSPGGGVYYERRKNRSDVPFALTGIKANVKQKLAKALLDYELADTIKATKEAQSRKIKYRKILKSL